MSQIEIERTYPHPIERVWRALTDAERLAAWLMPNDFEPTRGHAFTLRTDPGPGFDGIVRCQVLELEPPAVGSGEGSAHMVWSWVGGPIDTRVRFELRSVAGGTHLSVTQSGFRGVKAWLVSRILAAGARTLYGKHLPRVLDELARESHTSDPSSGPSPHPECMTPSQGFVQRLLAFLEPRRDR